MRTDNVQICPIGVMSKDCFHEKAIFLSRLLKVSTCKYPSDIQTTCHSVAVKFALVWRVLFAWSLKFWPLKFWTLKASTIVIQICQSIWRQRITRLMATLGQSLNLVLWNLAVRTSLDLKLCVYTMPPRHASLAMLGSRRHTEIHGDTQKYTSPLKST